MRFRRSFGSKVCCSSASRTATVSNMPSEPGGLVFRLILSKACAKISDCGSGGKEGSSARDRSRKSATGVLIDLEKSVFAGCMNSTHSAGFQKAQQNIRRDRGRSELPDVVAPASDALIQFVLNAGKFIGMNLQNPLRFNFFRCQF